MSRGEAGIPGGHGDRLVSHQSPHCLQVYLSHQQTASEGVPGVPGDALDLRLFDGGREPLAQILDQAIALGMEQGGIRREPELLVTLLEVFENLRGGTVESDKPVAAVFGCRQVDVRSTRSQVAVNCSDLRIPVCRATSS